MSKNKKPPKDPRKHHYVPVSYQDNFVNESGLLWVYDRQVATMKELHPRSICFEKDLYSVIPDQGPRNAEIEYKLLSHVDALGAWGIRAFENDQPHRDAEQAVAIFVAFQHLRVPTVSRDVRTTYAKAAQERARIAFANVRRAKIVMERVEGEGDVSDAAAESMVKAIQNNEVEIVATEVPFLNSMLNLAQGLSELIKTLNWQILVSPKETGFILSDCPVVLVPSEGCKEIGFLVPGTAIYLPLGRRLCLRLGEQGRLREYRNIGKEGVRIVNLNIAANSERFIMCPSKVQLENIIARSGCEGMEPAPRMVLEVFDADENEATLALIRQPRRYFYPKSGSHLKMS